MMSRKRWIPFLYLALVAVLSLVACAPDPEIIEKVVKETVIVQSTPQVVEKVVTSTPEPLEVNKGGTIIQCDFADAEVLNPILFTDEASDQVCQMMFNALIQLNPDDASVMPDLAKSWDVSADEMTFTYYLRDDVYWHDGEKFTAHDVKFTYDAMLNEQVNSPRRADFAGLVESENIVVVDDYTVRFTLNRVVPACRGSKDAT